MSHFVLNYITGLYNSIPSMVYLQRVRPLPTAVLSRADNATMVFHGRCHDRRTPAWHLRVEDDLWQDLWLPWLRCGECFELREANQEV